MENGYDIQAAQTALTTLLSCEGRDENKSSRENLWLFKTQNYEVHQIVSSPLTYKLVKHSGDLSESEEATFVAYGIIADKDLPPCKIESRFLRNEQSRSRYAAVVRQYVAITGLNIEDFNKLLESIERVHRYFGDCLPNNCLQPIAPLLIDDNIAMACYTRYFNPIRHCKSTESYPFGQGVDPNGELMQLGGSSYIHTEDNAVQYLEKKIEDEKPKYFNISPTRFQKGDIVEVIFSFFCIQTHTGDLKMITSLKSLILVDDKYRESAREERVKASISHHIKTGSLRLKRRFVETDDDESLLIKCARMDI